MWRTAVIVKTGWVKYRNHALPNFDEIRRSGALRNAGRGRRSKRQFEVEVSRQQPPFSISFSGHILKIEIYASMQKMRLKGCKKGQNLLPTKFKMAGGRNVANGELSDKSTVDCLWFCYNFESSRWTQLLYTFAFATLRHFVWSGS